MQFQLGKKVVAAVVAAPLALMAGAARAELPAAVTTAMTSFKTDATAMIDQGWPLLVAVFGGMVLMKLFKKVGNKAT